MYRAIFTSYLILYREGKGKFAHLPKHRLVIDRSKIFCKLKPFFVKFLKINILRFWRYENDDGVIKTSKSL